MRPAEAFHRPIVVRSVVVLPAARRLRFVVDFAYEIGLRASELVGATLGSLERDAHDDQWLHVVSKGSKAGNVRCHRSRMPPWTGI